MDKDFFWARIWWECRIRIRIYIRIARIPDFRAWENVFGSSRCFQSR